MLHLNIVMDPRLEVTGALKLIGLKAMETVEELQLYTQSKDLDLQDAQLGDALLLIITMERLHST